MIFQTHFNALLRTFENQRTLRTFRQKITHFTTRDLNVEEIFLLYLGQLLQSYSSLFIIHFQLNLFTFSYFFKLFRVFIIVLACVSVTKFLIIISLTTVTKVFLHMPRATLECGNFGRAMPVFASGQGTQGLHARHVV